MKHIVLLCVGLLLTAAVFAEEVSFTYQNGKSPAEFTVGDFVVNQRFIGGSGVKIKPEGYELFRQMSFDVYNKNEGMSSLQKIVFEQDDLDEVVIKTLSFKTKRFQIKLENVVKKDNPNAKKAHHPKYIVKSITYKVIITDL